MMNVLVVVGYGPGISHATAERFGGEGWAIALVGRNGPRVEDGASRLAGAGITALAYTADASDPTALRAVLRRVHDVQGPITALLWTAFRSGDVRDVLETDPGHLLQVFQIGITGLLSAVQEILQDLKDSDGGAILVANGALGDPSAQADAYAKALNNDGVALENAAKTKLVGLLAERLREHGVHVGEITVDGSVVGTATAIAGAIEPTAIADRFWSMTQERTTTRVRISG